MPSYYITLKFPIDIIHIPDACKAYTNMFFLPARNSLSKEISSRKLGNQPTIFDLDYTDVPDFTLVRDIKIPALAEKELENFATNIPEMMEVTAESLSTKLQEINRNYPYVMPDWLKIMLTVTSTVIATIVIAVIIYIKKSSNCLLGKHLWNNRKNKKTNFNESELREIKRSKSILTPHPLTHRSTANSCYSLAQRKIPQLPNTSHNQPDFPLEQHSSNVWNIQPLQIKESPKIKIPATSETVKNFLEHAGLNFHKYNKCKCTQARIVDPS